MSHTLPDPRGITRLITANPIVARTVVDEVLDGEIELLVVGDSDRFRLKMLGVQGIGTTSAIFRTRGDEDIVSTQLRTSYLLVHVLDGECWIERDGDQALVAAGGVTISPPGEQLAVRLRGQGTVRIVTIRQRLMRRMFAALTGFLPARPIRFDLTMAHDGHFLDTWARGIEHLLRELEDGTHSRDAGFLHDVEATFVDALLRYPCHEFHHRIRSDALPLLWDVSPDALEAAEFIAVLICAEPRREISTASYARIVNLAPRDLRNAFWWQWGITPAQYRRGVRLDCVHNDLRDPGLGWASIPVIARRWRLPSSARFYRWYYERFGELPGDTRGRVGEC